MDFLKGLTVAQPPGPRGQLVERKSQIFRVAGVAVAIVLCIVLIELVRQPSSALLIVLLAALAGLAVLGVFALEFAYVRNATITVNSSGLRLSGVALRRTRTCSSPALLALPFQEAGRASKLDLRPRNGEDDHRFDKPGELEQNRPPEAVLERLVGRG